MELRPYQRQALEAIRAAYRAGSRRALVVMPTGTGKTVLFAEVARLAKGPVLVVAHRQELVEQAREKISAWCDDVVAVEMADRRELSRPSGERPKITVASVQSMIRRLDGIPNDAFKILVIDEAHHSTAESYSRLIEHFDTWTLGVTATPDRSDRQQLGSVFDALAFDYDMLTAIDDGWLSPIRSFIVETEADFSGVRKIAGELSTSEVEGILTKEPHLVEIARPILSERGDRPAMVFAASVAHAYALSRVLCELSGDPDFAAAVDGTSHLDRRSEVVQRFRRGEIKVLVNCALFTEGFDVPQIALVAIARPILSRSFYAQMVGRGTRLSPGKEDLLVLDFVPSNCRHPLVQAVDIFARDDDEDDVVERARILAAEAGAEGEVVMLEQLLDLARQEIEARNASVSYRLTQRDPFGAVGIDVDGMIAERRSHGPSAGQRSRGARPTDDQRAWLKKAGLDAQRIDELSAAQADELRETLLERKAVGLSTPKQAYQLAQLGIDAEDLYYDAAQEMLKEARRLKKLAYSNERIRSALTQEGEA